MRSRMPMTGLGSRIQRQRIGRGHEEPSRTNLYGKPARNARKRGPEDARAREGDCGVATLRIGALVRTDGDMLRCFD